MCAHGPAGARIASLVVSRPELFAEWNEEMEYMSGRIKVPRSQQPIGFNASLPLPMICLISVLIRH